MFTQAQYNNLLLKDSTEVFFGEMDIFRKKNVLYHGLELNPQSKEDILYSLEIPEGWVEICHHITFGLGMAKPNSEFFKRMGSHMHFLGTHVGFFEDKVMAIKVEGNYFGMNKTPHVTIAVNFEGGGKPMQSNFITQWNRLDTPFEISGILTEFLK